MEKHLIKAGVLVDEQSTISFVEVCQRYDIAENWLIDLLDQGLFNVSVINRESLLFNQTMLRRIQSARRLQHDLNINLSGVVLVLELLDQLSQVRQELDILQRHVDNEPT